MTDLTGALAILDRLTDPLPRALEDARQSLAELFVALDQLATATVKNKNGEDEDRLWDIEFLVGAARDAFDTLGEEVEKR